MFASLLGYYYYSNVCLLSACQVIFSIVSCHHFGYDGKLLLLYYRGLSKGRGVGVDRPKSAPTVLGYDI